MSGSDRLVTGSDEQRGLFHDNAIRIYAMDAPP